MIKAYRQNYLHKKYLDDPQREKTLVKQLSGI